MISGVIVKFNILYSNNMLIQDIPDNESDIVDDASHEPAGSQLIDNEEVKDDGKEEASGGAARKRVIQATTD